MFTVNVGKADRIARIVLGLVLLLVWYMNPAMSLRWLLLIVGLIMLATGFLKTCPLYTVLGISTCPARKS